MINREHEHDWREGYYGWECDCGEFIPFGCEPWVPTDDEIHEMILALRRTTANEVSTDL